LPSNTDLSERPSGGSDEPTEETEEKSTDDQPVEESEDKPAGEQPAEESEDKPAGEQPAEESDDKPAGEQPTEESDDKPAGEQPAEESDDKPAGEQAAEESDDKPVGEQPAEKSEDKPADEQATEQKAGEDAGAQPAKQADGTDGKSDKAGATGELSAGRKEMLALIEKWMPTSLLNPRVDGKSVNPGQDLMAKAGWYKTTGDEGKRVKDQGGHPVTSCGDILRAMLELWRSNFVGSFYLRDEVYEKKNGIKTKMPGAKARGYYVEADKVEGGIDGEHGPKPGDIIHLRDGVGKNSIGTIGHVGILVEFGKDEWRTADGGGGELPDQTASVTPRKVLRLENNIPVLRSPTDAREKLLDGWIDLDRLKQTG